MNEASLVASHPAVEPLLGPRSGAQRARLLVEMINIVGEKGWAQTTVADAVKAAKVSRGTFYALFASKEECLIEGYRYGVDVLMGHIDEAVAEAKGDWQVKLRAGMRSYLVSLSTRPMFARAHLIELPLAGTQAQTERDATLRQFAERFRASYVAGLRDHPELTMPSDDMLYSITAGVDQLVSLRLREGRHAQLPELEDTLTGFALAAFFGTAAAPPASP
jgi:AcrR family transcriptional regulator